MNKCFTLKVNYRDIQRHSPCQVLYNDVTVINKESFPVI